MSRCISNFDLGWNSSDRFLRAHRSELEASCSLLVCLSNFCVRPLFCVHKEVIHVTFRIRKVRKLRLQSVLPQGPFQNAGGKKAWQKCFLCIDGEQNSCSCKDCWIHFYHLLFVRLTDLVNTSVSLGGKRIQHPPFLSAVWEAYQLREHQIMRVQILVWSDVPMCLCWMRENTAVLSLPFWHFRTCLSHQETKSSRIGNCNIMLWTLQAKPVEWHFWQSDQKGSFVFSSFWMHISEIRERGKCEHCFRSTKACGIKMWAFA